MKTNASFDHWHRHTVTSRAHVTKRCVTCQNKKLAEACRQFAVERRKGSHVSWAYFHRAFVLAEMDIKNVKLSAMLNHVRNCMGIHS